MWNARCSDINRLTAYLVANSEFPSGAVEVKQFNKGQSNPTYLLTASDGHRYAATPHTKSLCFVLRPSETATRCARSRYVVRKQPPGDLLKGAHAIDREYRVLDALKGTSSTEQVSLCLVTHLASVSVSCPSCCSRCITRLVRAGSRDRRACAAHLAALRGPVCLTSTFSLANHFLIQI
jgi:hypothetical protein